MAREARKISSKGMYSIRLSGECLIKDDEDKKTFEEMAEKYFAKGKVYGCAAEPSEIRMVVKEAPNGISMTMKPLITSYARYFNKKYSLTGKLFSDRFKSEPIESESERRAAVEALAETGTVKRKTVKKSGDAKTKTAKKPPEKEKSAEPVRKPVNRNVMPSYLL